MKQTCTYRLSGVSKGKRRRLNKPFGGMCLWHNFFVFQCKENSEKYRAWKADPENGEKPKPPSYYDWCNLITRQKKAGGVPNKDSDLVDTAWMPLFGKRMRRRG